MNQVLHKKLIDISKNLNQSGPRYTSYPTVPEWKDWHVENYINVLHNLKSEQFSLYLHFPYCKTKCLFCACNAYVSNSPDIRNSYIDSLSQEITNHTPFLQNKKIKQLHLGGGTPTYTEVNQLERILNQIHSNFSFSDNAEKSVEIDPRTIDDKKIELLSNFGFRRASFGVQDFDPKVQEFIRRNHSADEIKKVVDDTRAAGIEEINLDIIYGLNHQTRESWTKTLEQVLSINPNRVASYSYAKVPWKKKHQLALNTNEVSASEKLALLLITRDFFTSNGYIAIGMDHFALPNDPLAIAYKNNSLHRNFMGYTDEDHGTYIGMGCSAIGWTNNSFFQNISSPSEYQKKISTEKFATIKGFHLSKEDQIRQWVIQSIMNYGVVTCKEFTNKFDLDFLTHFTKELQSLEPIKELVSVSNERLKLTEYGHFFPRNVAMKFDQYYQTHVENKFSSSV